MYSCTICCRSYKSSESQIAGAMRFLYENEALVTEGGAAVGVAALLAGLVDVGAKNIVCVISGCNVDMNVFTSIVNGEWVDKGD